ncbi:MAG: ubiquinol-cytochrome c reductase iron-sulfur subunit [Frankiales bacterium]|nr:ubiquinol-cytochrome c reductase iron-sulfur subunit [Frankiales bacterium]
MSDSIRDRLKPAEDTPEVHHAEHPAGDPVVSTHHAYHPDLRNDPKRAKRAEIAVSALFLLAVVGVIGFVVTYIAAPFNFGTANYQTFTPLLGIFMTLALTGIGSGAVLWAKTLMVDEETVQERHHLASDPKDRAETVEILKEGFEESGLPRRSLLRNSILLGAGSLAVLPVPLLFGLGRFQHKEAVLSKTGWKAGSRLLDELGRPVKLGDLEVGGVKSVFPDVPGGRRMADSAALLIRMLPEDLHTSPSRKDWVQEGHIVYSVICTHLGCPVKLYEQQTHHLFCPCHQSTFDAANEAKVLFGPAARNLPQLAISVDADGYFVAQGDFTEPVGPSFWERKPSYSDKVGA